jgi:hypothetical protein
MSVKELLAEFNAVVKDLKGLKRKFEVLLRPRKRTGMSVEDITTFFSTSTRADNDATNKVREGILELITNPSKECLDHPVHGVQWRQVSTEWRKALTLVAKDHPYTSIQIKRKGGRGANYDAEATFLNGTTVVLTKKLEFKKGGTSINGLPQFLSLQVRAGLFEQTYDTFWYQNYLEAYRTCDKGLTVAVPDLTTYLKLVTATTSKHPFFVQLKERESIAQEEKSVVVKRSITDYLERFGSTIHTKAFAEKVRATQTDKVYLLWSKGTFHIDGLLAKEMTDMVFDSIKNGNTIVLRAGTTTYHLLLRWRNHKGILNPAWQIAMHRD